MSVVYVFWIITLIDFSWRKVIDSKIPSERIQIKSFRNFVPTRLLKVDDVINESIYVETLLWSAFVGVNIRQQKLKDIDFPTEELVLICELFGSR